MRKYARDGRLTRNIVIVGAGEQAKRLVAEIQSAHEPWNVIVAVFDDRLHRTGPWFAGIPVVGTVNALMDFARKHRVDDVIVAMPWFAAARIRGIVNKLSELPVQVHLGSDLVAFEYGQGHYSPLAGVNLLCIAVKPLGGWRLVLKNLEDKVFSAFLLTLLSPVMLLTALAIKLDSKGPVFFRQARYGFNNGAFSVLKFRTMHINRKDEDNVPQATRDDPRVTRVGRFLRRTSLDELPQLINVLQGTMSLVGPRPHAVPHNEEYSSIIEGYSSRHKVKPGITGWAQVNGYRGETDTPDKMKARVEHDVWYIENWSLLRDFYILILTAYVVWGQKNAY